MPRFEGPPDPLFRASTPRSASTAGCGRRTSPDRGRTSARFIERECSRTPSAVRCSTVSTRVAAELEREEFEFEDGDEDIHMAVERRLTEIVGPVGGKLHTGRSRNDQVATDLALFVRERAASGDRADPGADGPAARPRRSPRGLGDARLHPSAACPARLPRTPPARILLDARAATRRGSRPRARPPARCRSDPALSPASTGSSTATRAPPSSASTRRRRTRSTRSPTATSSSTTCSPPPSARPISRGWAASW